MHSDPSKNRHLTINYLQTRSNTFHTIPSSRSNKGAGISSFLLRKKMQGKKDGMLITSVPFFNNQLFSLNPHQYRRNPHPVRCHQRVTWAPPAKRSISPPPQFSLSYELCEKNELCNEIKKGNKIFSTDDLRKEVAESCIIHLLFLFHQKLGVLYWTTPNWQWFFGCSNFLAREPVCR